MAYQHSINDTSDEKKARITSDLAAAVSRLHMTFMEHGLATPAIMLTDRKDEDFFLWLGSARPMIGYGNTRSFSDQPDKDALVKLCGVNIMRAPRHTTPRVTYVTHSELHSPLPTQLDTSNSAP